MSSLVWLNQKNTMHTWGLEILSTDKYTVENFVYNQVVELCKKFDAKYFIQGFQVRDYGHSWAFVEFFGEGSDDKILQIMEEFNKVYGSAYHGKEIQMDEPSRELLVSLNLF